MVVEVGEYTTFHWNIENAVSCFGNNKPRTPSGNNGRHSYGTPQTKRTSWVCEDKEGNKINLSAYLYIQAPEPYQPQNLAGNASGNYLNFSWSHVSDSDYYRYQVRKNSGTWQGSNTSYSTSIDMIQDPGSYQFRVRACNNYSQCSGYTTLPQILTIQAPAMKVKQFQWLPSQITAGETASFHWNIENAASCFGNNKIRTPSGNNGNHQYNDPKYHVTKWYCNDKFGNRLPANPNQFLEASLSITAPAMRVNQFQWIPSQITAGETASFHWNIENAESCFGNNKIRTPSGNNGNHQYNDPKYHVTKWYCNDKFGNRLPANPNQFLEASLSITAPAMRVNQFQWIPSQITAGETASFHWNIENAESCFGNNKIRTPSGNNGNHQYNDPKYHVTKWYCNDKYGNRLPADPNKFLEAPLSITAPAMRVNQFQWIPSQITAGETASFHWNVENAESCYGNGKTRAANGNNGNHRYDEPKLHTTKWFCNDKYGNRIPFDENKFLETTLNIKPAPKMVVKQFEWLPKEITAGETASFHWNVENAESCYGNGKTRAANGNNGNHRYDEPKLHTTKWFCNDKYGNRIPFDENKFLETTLNIKPAPKMVVKQFEWLPKEITAGETASFHWNVENAESCFGNNKTRASSGNNGNHRYDEPKLHTTKWFCNDKFGNRIPVDTNTFLETTLNIKEAPKMVVKQFEWLPAVIKSGEKTAFYWNITNAKTCFATTHGPNQPLEREHEGQNNYVVYNDVKVHTTKWYCEDKYGNRIPENEAEFLKATRTVNLSKPTISPSKLVIEQSEKITIKHLSKDISLNYAVLSINESCSTVNDWQKYVGPFNLQSSSKICTKSTKDSFIDSEIESRLFNVVKINKFAWHPIKSYVGTKNTFYWDISGVNDCRANKNGVAEKLPNGEYRWRGASGNNGIHVYEEPKEHITKWECFVDSAKTIRFPSDPNLFIEAPLSVKDFVIKIKKLSLIGSPKN
ncbi:hypothetical protein CJF42_25090 [Pseudoalteromonas sp. NBT06-2]|nr:hypothetical protein CJF42_25090 [Pseudoalteromonas sp. NBT06-2]